MSGYNTALISHSSHKASSGLYKIDMQQACYIFIIISHCICTFSPLRSVTLSLISKQKGKPASLSLPCFCIHIIIEPVWPWLHQRHFGEVSQAASVASQAQISLLKLPRVQSMGITMYDTSALRKADQGCLYLVLYNAQEK